MMAGKVYLHYLILLICNQQLMVGFVLDLQFRLHCKWKSRSLLQFSSYSLAVVPSKPEEPQHH